MVPRPKLKIFEIPFVPKPHIKLKLIELVIKLETKGFETKCPLMGACKSSLELQVNAFFLPL